jgi:hypothetical protein
MRSLVLRPLHRDILGLVEQGPVVLGGYARLDRELDQLADHIAVNRALRELRQAGLVTGITAGTGRHQHTMWMAP